MVERRPGIWSAGRELLELIRALLEEEERERKERALGRIRPWEVHDEATTTLTSGWLTRGAARRRRCSTRGNRRNRSDRPATPVVPVEHGVLHTPPRSSRRTSQCEPRDPPPHRRGRRASAATRARAASSATAPSREGAGERLVKERERTKSEKIMNKCRGFCLNIC